MKNWIIVILILVVLLGLGNVYTVFQNFGASLAELSGESRNVKIYGGETKIKMIAGEEVRVNIPIDHCLDIAPRGVFSIRENAAGTYALIASKSGRAEEATIEALPAWKCPI